MTDANVIALMLDRLQGVPGISTLEEAWFAKPLDDLGADTPALLPYLSGEDADEVADLRQTQLVVQTFDLWLICPRAQFKPLRDEVRRALKGWQPSERHTLMSYVNGRTENIIGPMIWWRERWQTSSHIRA